MRVLPLAGRTLALLESRRVDHLALLVERLGGTVVSAPMVREVARRHETRRALDAVLEGRVAVIVFMSGAGAAALLNDAERLGCLVPVSAALSRCTIAARGPKPLAVLKRYGLSPTIVSARPHTGREMVDALVGAHILAAARTVLVHAGERHASMASELSSHGAVVDDVCAYEWALPRNLGAATSLIQAATRGALDAILFTNQVQCRYLFRIAAAQGEGVALLRALREQTVVGAIGPVCGDALRRYGITPDVLPAAAHMASLVSAVADYFDLTAPRPLSAAADTWEGCVAGGPAMRVS